jgi:hypothetical protein
MLGPDPDFLFGTDDFTWQLGRASKPCTSLASAVAFPRRPNAVDSLLTESATARPASPDDARIAFSRRATLSGSPYLIDAF